MSIRGGGKALLLFSGLWLLLIFGVLVERLLTGEEHAQTWVLYGLFLLMPTLLGMLRRKPAALCLIAISISADIGFLIRAWVAGHGLLSSDMILVLLAATIPGLTGLFALAVRVPEENAEGRLAGYSRKW